MPTPDSTGSAPATGGRRTSRSTSRAEAQGRGVGRALYDALIPMLRDQGFVNVYAGITLPNPASVALHEAIGMRRIGVYERVGWKFGAWRDVAWYGMRIAEPHGAPPEPRPVPRLDRRLGRRAGIYRRPLA